MCIDLNGPSMRLQLNTYIHIYIKYKGNCFFFFHFNKNEEKKRVNRDIGSLKLNFLFLKYV